MRINTHAAGHYQPALAATAMPVDTASYSFQFAVTPAAGGAGNSQRRYRRVPATPIKMRSPIQSAFPAAAARKQYAGLG